MSNRPTEAGENSPDLPDHVRTYVEKLSQIFSAYQGPQAYNMMYDYVALAKGLTSLRSRMNEHSLQIIKNHEFSNWTTDDFKLLLDELSNKNEYLAGVIRSVTTEVEEDSEM